MSSLSVRVMRGPNKGRPLALACDQHGIVVATLDKNGAGRVEHGGHGAYFSPEGGARAAFHQPRRRSGMDRLGR